MPGFFMVPFQYDGLCVLEFVMSSKYASRPRKTLVIALDMQKSGENMSNGKRNSADCENISKISAILPTRMD